MNASCFVGICVCNVYFQVAGLKYKLEVNKSSISFEMVQLFGFITKRTKDGKT